MGISHPFPAQVDRAHLRGLPTVVVRPGNLGGCDPRTCARPGSTADHVSALAASRQSKVSHATQIKSVVENAGKPRSLRDRVAEAGWNTSDGNLLFLAGMANLGLAPDVAGWRCELTPVDWAAKAVVAAAASGDAVGKHFNLINERTMTMAAVVDALRTCGVDVQTVPYADFRARLEAATAETSDAAAALYKPLWNLVAPLETADALAANDAVAAFETAKLEALCAKAGVGAYPPLDAVLAREYAYDLLARGVLPKGAPPLHHHAASSLGLAPLRGEVAFVTGASGGIGAAIARALGAAGAKVCLAARRVDRVRALAKEIAGLHGVQALGVQCDVTDRAAVKAAVAEATAALGPVTALVNNAGVMHYTFMRNLHEDEWAQAVDVNCKGVLNGVGAVLSDMIANKRGHILTVSSDAGRKAFPGLAVYSGTKFFVEALSQGLRAETVGTGVKVTTIQPGDCKSDLKACTTDEEARAEFAQQSDDRAVWLDPNDVAKTVVFALSQPPHVSVNEILVEPRDAPA